MSKAAAGRAGVEVSISIPTILLVAGAVAIAWALASIANVLLLIFVSILSAAVLVPVVSVMERRLRWSRRLCAFVLVLAIVIVIGAVVLVLAQAISDAVRDFSDDLPQIVDRVRHSDLGDFINGGSGSLDTLREHAGDITKGVGEVSGGVADVGVSAFGAVTLVFSVTFLTLFGLIDAPHARDWIGSLLYRDKRERYLQVTDRIIQTTSRYMLGNVAISLICATVYGVTAVILGLPYPLALAVIAGLLDLIPNLGATIAGLIIGLVALSVSLDALIVFAIVIVVYQQIENYVLQPTIIGKAARISGFTVLASVLAFGALFGLIGAIIAVPIAAGLQIVTEELTAARRARIAAADTAERATLPGRARHPQAALDASHLRHLERRRVRGELARHRARVDLLEGRPGLGRLRHASGVDEPADRILVELKALAHVRARLRPVAEVVDLQLDVVAVRIAVVVGERHAVVEAEVRHDPGLLEPQVARVELVEAVVLEGGVVQPRPRVLLGVVDEVRERGQRDPVVGLVVGDPGAERIPEEHLGPEQHAVPVDHLLEPGGLEVDVVQLGVDDGSVSGHRR